MEEEVDLPSGRVLKSELKKRIERDSFQCYLTTRVIVKGLIYERRFYFFPDFSLMYYDTNERYNQIKFKSPGDFTLAMVNKAYEPKRHFLDHLIYHRKSNRLEVAGISKFPANLLLDSFWSDSIPDVYKTKTTIIKKINLTNMLDILESIYNNKEIEVKED